MVYVNLNPDIDFSRKQTSMQDTRSRAASASTKGDGHDLRGSGRPRRRLGVCEGDAHALMLEEMLKGANVVISGDSGKFQQFFACVSERVFEIR